jgi:hypothetical protein
MKIVMDPRARKALVSAAIAICVPLVCATIGRRPGTAWALRDVLGWLALGTGVVGGVAAVVLGTSAALQRLDRPNVVAGLAVVAGLVAIPVSFFCAIVAGGPIR